MLAVIIDIDEEDAMLKLFLHKSKGSITVMVTLLLIPTVFFTGFLTDLARIKLYSNQAVMAADNYGEGIIAEYDNLLKELYGLFAISQDEAGKNAIKELQNYMNTSFNPSQNTIVWNHLAGKTNLLSGSYDGFMPYKSAELTFSNQYVESSKLSNPEIMSTQIGDFMRFRIVQEMMNSEGEDFFLEALEAVENTEGDAEVIDKKSEFDEESGKVLEKMKDYYDILLRLYHYPEYIEDINTAYKKVKGEFESIVDSEHYKLWREYMENEESITAARQVPEDKRSDEEKQLVDIGDSYDSDDEARSDALMDTFDAAIEVYEESNQCEEVDFESFEDLADDLYDAAVEVDNAFETLRQKKEQLENALNNNNVTKEVRDGIQDDINTLDRLSGGSYTGETYIGIANCIKSNISVNDQYDIDMQGQVYQLEQIRSDYLEIPIGEISTYKEQLDINNYTDFTKTVKYNELYEMLVKTFEEGNNSQAEADAKDKKDKANKEKNKAEEELEKEKQEKSQARNIPDGEDFNSLGDKSSGGGFKVNDLIKTASSYFKLNSFSEAGNKLLLKFYVVAYDFGMFSSRTTNVDENAEKAVSLTGVEICKSVNYLYQAELEYLYGGHKNSDSNLEAARNHILAFRAVVNMASTYKIKVVNDSINIVRNSLSGINPILGIAAAAALRAGFTAIETAADWQALKKGESIVLIKSEMGDLESKDAIASLLGISISDSKSNSMEMNYNQHLIIMLTFLTTSDQIIQRTSDLITLNVNAVKNKVGEDGTLTSLSFKMENAYTAVDATCAVHLNMVVMPMGVAKKTLDSSTYNEVESFDKNVYKFTVTRGY
jgi:hypothetical protein